MCKDVETRNSSLPTHTLCLKSRLNSCLLPKASTENLRPQRSLLLPNSYRARLEAPGDHPSFPALCPVPRTVLYGLSETAVLQRGVQDESNKKFQVASFLLILQWKQEKKKIFYRMSKVKKKSSSFSWWKTKHSLLKYDSAFSACKVLFFCKMGFLIFDKFLRTPHSSNFELWGLVQRFV